MIDTTLKIKIPNTSQKKAVNKIHIQPCNSKKYVYFLLLPTKKKYANKKAITHFTIFQYATKLLFKTTKFDVSKKVLLPF